MTGSKIKLMALMPDMALIGAQKMCLSLLDTLDGEKVFKIELVLLSNQSEGILRIRTLPNFTVLKKWNKGVLSKFDTVLSVYRLRKLIYKYRPDVILSIAPIMNLFLLLSLCGLSKYRPITIIEEHQHLTTSMNDDKSSHHWMMNFFYKNLLFLYRKADAIKLVSDASKLDFANNWALPASKLVVMNPPIVTSKLQELSMEEMPLEIIEFVREEGDVVFSLGRIESQKNFTLLVEAFAVAHRHNPTIKLIIVGEGSQKELLLEKIRLLGISDSVLLTGFVSNPYPIFRIAKVFCLTSIWEGMPVTIMESMALGCPVVSVDCPSGPSEMIENGVNGFLVKSNALDIASAITDAIRDRDKLSEMRSQCKKTAQKWDISVYSANFISLVSRLIGKKKRVQESLFH